MLAQPHRLPATTRLTHAKFYKTLLFSVKYTKNDLTVSRFAFLVRKTVDKRAVARNRIRRVFRSCIEEQLTAIYPGYDMLFFLEKGIIDKKQADLCQIVQQLLRERKLMK
ncbi:MAG: ribonuclease P protein component [Candidatus Levybacteria bacterium]|nr:ribonuclease P protein component [Candidatus Levybacteria bacterium]